MPCGRDLRPWRGAASRPQLRPRQGAPLEPEKTATRQSPSPFSLNSYISISMSISISVIIYLYFYFYLQLRALSVLLFLFHRDSRSIPCRRPSNHDCGSTLCTRISPSRCSSNPCRCLWNVCFGGSEQLGMLFVVFTFFYVFSKTTLSLQRELHFWGPGPLRKASVVPSGAPFGGSGSPMGSSGLPGEVSGSPNRSSGTPFRVWGDAKWCSGGLTGALGGRECEI